MRKFFFWVPRRSSKFIISIFILAAACALSHQAFASLLGPSRLDPRYCKIPTFRQTVVYIDDSIMVAGQTGWAEALSNRLDASLMPGEKVTVVELSPAAGTSKQIWSGCWPGLPASGSKPQPTGFLASLFSSGPKSQLQAQRQLFTKGLGTALGEIYEHAQRLKAGTRVPSSDLPKKRILEALASDGARFAQSSKTNRVIVYTDAAQNSSVAAVMSPDFDPSVNYGAKLGAYFPRSLFYFYGVGGDLAEGQDYISTARKFWRIVLAHMSAALVELGSDLVIPNRIPIHAYGYTVQLDHGGQTLFGRMRILVDRDGHLEDSWISITRLWTVALTGNFSCRQRGDCVLRAKTIGKLTTSSNVETVAMTGSARDHMKGTVGVPGAMTFNLVATGSHR